MADQYIAQATDPVHLRLIESIEYLALLSARRMLAMFLGRKAFWHIWLSSGHFILEDMPPELPRRFGLEFLSARAGRGDKEIVIQAVLRDGLAGPLMDHGYDRHCVVIMPMAELRNIVCMDASDLRALVIPGIRRAMHEGELRDILGRMEDAARDSGVLFDAP